MSNRLQTLEHLLREFNKLTKPLTNVKAAVSCKLVKHQHDLKNKVETEKNVLTLYVFLK